jgi:hypothetical protein
LILTNSIHQFKSDDSKKGQQVTGAAGANFDNEDAVEVEVESQNEKAKSTPRLSSQAKRNLRKKILKRQGRKKQKVESDDDLAKSLRSTAIVLVSVFILLPFNLLSVTIFSLNLVQMKGRRRANIQRKSNVIRRIGQFKIIFC